MVKRRVEEGESPEDALRAALLEVLEELGQSQYRNLLEIVLGLDPKTADMTAAEKRALAGKEFRGGKKPVTAGTIRQHHEPRALEELAEKLVSQLQVAEPGRPTAQQWIEWHPAVREAWGQQELSLWRLSLTNYDSNLVAAVLSALMREHHVPAWTAHQMFGVFDLLLEAWLPASLRTSAFARALEEAFGGRLVRCDNFVVDEVVTHWAWQESDQEGIRIPSDRWLEEVPDQRQLARLQGGDRKLLRDFQEKGIASQVFAEPGIGLLLVIGGLAGLPLLSLAERESLKARIVHLLEEAAGEVVFQTALLRGHGFGDFVLEGRVPPKEFHKLGPRLVEPLNEVLKILGMQTQTFIFAAAEPLLREERLIWDASEDAHLSAEDLLRQGESAQVEVRTSGFADLLPDDRVGARGVRSDAARMLTKTITGMLNGRGGTIVVGAFSHSRAEEDPRFAGKRLGGAPVVGGYVVIGVDEEIEGRRETYLRRAAAVLSKSIEPDPSLYVEMRLEDLKGRTVLVLSVRRTNDWFYFVDEAKGAAFIVRNSDGMLRRLGGAEMDVYKRNAER